MSDEDVPVREQLARHLYIMWCISSDGPRGPGDEPEWSAWHANAGLNPVGLSRKDFLEEADRYLNGIAFWERDAVPVPQQSAQEK